MPLRCTQGKTQTTGRGSKAVTVKKMTFKQSRRPKARPSLKLSRKGKLYQPRNVDDRGTVYDVGRDSERLSSKPAPPRTCESESCKERGSCTHNLPSKGKHFLVLVEVTKRAKGKVVVRDGFVWVQERFVRAQADAADFAVAHMKARNGVTSVRVLATYTDARARKELDSNPRNYFRNR